MVSRVRLDLIVVPSFLLRLAAFSKNNDAVTIGSFRLLVTPQQAAVFVKTRAPAFLAASGLECNDADGAVVVDHHFQVVNAHGVFAAGDCLHFAPRPLAKIGVFAVREAPILIHNLLAFLASDPLQIFTPQDVFLSILNLGNRHALAYRGNLAWSGRSAWWLKDRIDRRWLELYR